MLLAANRGRLQPLHDAIVVHGGRVKRTRRVLRVVAAAAARDALLLRHAMGVWVEGVLLRLPRLVLLLAHLAAVRVEVQLVVMVEAAVAEVVQSAAHHLLGLCVDLWSKRAVAKLLLLHLHLDLRELAVLLANLGAVP